jgi:hypothetical protein
MLPARLCRTSRKKTEFRSEIRGHAPDTGRPLRPSTLARPWASSTLPTSCVVAHVLPICADFLPESKQNVSTGRTLFALCVFLCADIEVGAQAPHRSGTFCSSKRLSMPYLF